MLLVPLRWLSRNVSTLLLAFILAIVVWVSAVLDADPNVEQVYPFPIEIEVTGLDSSLLIVKQVPADARLTIIAPQSIWDRLSNNPDLVRAWVDLSGLGPGEHAVELSHQVSATPSEVVTAIPEEVQIILEALATRTFDVQPVVRGEPPTGYRRGEIMIEPTEVMISGAESLVNQVREVRAPIDITGSIDTVSRVVAVQPVDENGNPVLGLTVTPQEVSVTQMVNLLGGYRNVVVKVITTGEPAEGYWLTNISVSPPSVTVFASNPQLVNELPGFVETEPLDLTGLRDDADMRSSLDLPEGISIVDGQPVLVRIGVAALEGNIKMTLIPEVTGLPPDLAAEVVPETLDLTLSGPLPVLYTLTPASIRVTLDLGGQPPGVYQVTPVVDLLPDNVQVDSILPQVVQVTVGPVPTSTATSNVPVTVIPSPTPAPTAAPDTTETPAP
jgi:YbbR domain-containing protein